MKTVIELYDMADEKGITVDYFKLKSLESMSLMDNHSVYYIAIDPDKITSPSDEKVKLAHELGHCETCSFYNKASPLDIREKHENHADRWAVQQLIPKAAIRKAIKTGYREIWEMAEYFDVTEDFMRKALEYYKVCG